MIPRAVGRAKQASEQAPDVAEEPVADDDVLEVQRDSGFIPGVTRFQRNNQRAQSRMYVPRGRKFTKYGGANVGALGDVPKRPLLTDRESYLDDWQMTQRSGSGVGLDRRYGGVKKRSSRPSGFSLPSRKTMGDIGSILGDESFGIAPVIGDIFNMFTTLPSKNKAKRGPAVKKTFQDILGLGKKLIPALLL